MFLYFSLVNFASIPKTLTSIDELYLTIERLNAGDPSEFLPRVPILPGVVGVHVPDDRRGDRDHQVLERGRQCGDEELRGGAVRGGDADGGGAAVDNGSPRLAGEIVPQRRIHRHKREEAEILYDAEVVPPARWQLGRRRGPVPQVHGCKRRERK